MLRNKRFGLVLLAVVFAAGFVLGNLVQPSAALSAQAGGKVYELRTYTAAPGKLSDLESRFRDHTVRLFEKHGMTNVGYWVATDAPLSENTLLYVLEYDSRDAATASWDAFRADPDWVEARAESERNGRLVSGVESVFMKATDYSPIN